MLRRGAVLDAPLPADRWAVELSGVDNQVAGLVRRGAFFVDVEDFDPAPFGITPREAADIDPRHRLLLELTWSALDDAGLPVERLYGTRSGVYIAIGGGPAPIPASVSPHTFTGIQQALAANRVSRLLRATGPSMVVDTGQSSSLVAVHLAAESLRSGASDVALAGGVTLRLSGMHAVAAHEFGALSPDGRCHVFDERANGFGQGEGGAVVVLKRLRDAVADGDRVYCVLPGGAVRHDSGGTQLGEPSVDAQADLLQAACAAAGVSPFSLTYVELHGTGTPAGDRTEAAALGQVFGAGRSPSEPLRVGSVKSTTGHLDAAAGVVGLLKLALNLHANTFTPTAGFVSAHPDLALPHNNLRVQESEEEAPSDAVCGVSSFGLGGTQCHLIVTPAPTASPSTEDTGESATAAPLLLSAASATALRARAHDLVDLVDTGTTRDVAWSLTQRTALPHRAAILAPDALSARTALAAVANAEPAEHAILGRARPASPVFAFPGQGGQWAGMGRDLAAHDPVFDAALDECAEALSPHIDWDLRAVLRSDSLDRVDVVQPALWAVMIALTKLWNAAGVRPAAVVGHSQGEIAAAHTAGVLTLEDSARIVAVRSRLIAERLAGRGGMAAVGMSARDLDLPPDVHVAAVNSPINTILSGPQDALAELRAGLRARGVRCTLLPVDYPSHSPAVEAIRDDLLTQLAPIAPRPAQIPLYSSVTGARVAGTELTASYWYDNLRNAVRFDEAVRAAAADGHRVMVEPSPHPVLTPLVDVPDLVTATTLRRGEDGPARVAAALAYGWTIGLPVSPSALVPRGKLMPLPAYPFDRAHTAAGGPAPNLVGTLELVRAHTAAVMGKNVEDVELDTGFRDQGLTSAVGVELCAALTASTGSPLPPAAVFDHPTPRALARHLERGAERPTARARVAEPGVPVAVIGAACRFPGGVDSPEALWDVVSRGLDVTGELPTDRGWDLIAPALVGARGGFLHRAAEFDPGFFGISPREALAMDPQQRLLLETAWEAVERAGLDPITLRGQDVGVFNGVMAQEYGPRQHEVSGPAEGYLLTGTSPSVASGRVSYALGLTGPALTIDTACSSALVAVHTAMRALRAGECELALAGAATVMASPGIFAEFGAQGGMAADGRCKAYGAGADGTGWAEGAGTVLLERLSDARRAGHPVLAVLRGSAVNSDGASTSLTAPNGTAQRVVITRALADAGLPAAGVDLVEGHGTGTRLGDPVEVGALLDTYGRDRAQPVRLGSVKSNIGHTQAAAGLAGLLKVIGALRAGVLPPTLYADTPSPHVDWSAGGVRPQVVAEPWPERAHPRRAAVSAFGISGTNAHLVVEAPEPAAGPVDDQELVLRGHTGPLILSGHTDAAVAELAGRLADHPAGDLDLAFSLATGRTAFDHRVVVPGPLRGRALPVLARGGVPADILRVRRTGPASVVFVYPGQGGQWAGMGRDLLDTSPVFAAAVAECAAVLAPHVSWDLVQVLRDDPLDRVDVVQPALWAVMIALTKLWNAAGVRPAAVVGHSQGEIAAAHTAGVLTLEDSARIVAVRSRLIAEHLSGNGAMAAVALPADAITLPGGAHVAAINSPTSTVVSGTNTAVSELLDQLQQRGVRCTRIPVDYASHSAQVDVVREDLTTELAGISPAAGHTVFCSSVTGTALAGADLTAEYWFRNLREPVRFSDAVVAAGGSLVVEPSPHPTLVGAVADVVHGVGAVPTLVRADGGAERVATAFGAAWAHGAAVDWAAVFAGTGAQRVDLPTTAFQRTRFWLETGSRAPEHDPLRYQVRWPVVADPIGSPTGTWLVVEPDRGDARAAKIADALAGSGAQPRRVPVEDLTPEALQHVSGVVSLVGMDDTPDSQHPSVPTGLSATLTVLQSVDATPVWHLTSGAVGAGIAPANPAQSAIWGLCRVASLEQPDSWGGLIDLPDGTLDARTARQLLGALASAEDQVALRADGVHVRRLAHVPPLPDVEPGPPHDTLLITGGTGALGAHVARHHARRGARHLILVGARGPEAPGAVGLAAELRDTGCRVSVLACDTGDRAALAELLTGLRDERLTGVVHAAGVLDDAVVSDLTAAQLDRVMRVKADGARYLDELTAGLPLREFVLFSSLAGVLGIPGQGGYAPANAVLDALAERRRALGLPATALAWGPWAGAGMAEGGVGDRLARHGVPAVPPERALAVLDGAAAEPAAGVLVADVRWSRFDLAYSEARPRPLLADLSDVRAARETRATPATPGVGVAGADRAGRAAAVVGAVRGLVADVLGHGDPGAVDLDRSFRDLGFDSLTGVELRNRVAAELDVRLPSTLVFDHPSPRALVDRVLDDLAVPVDEHRATAGTTDDPVVVIGMACRYPGGVDTPDALWDLVSAGADAVGPFPTDRGWDLDRLCAGAGVATGGAFLPEMADFDAEFFGISPREALAMDPQHRLLLETAWHALEHAGVDPRATQGSRGGVFLGLSHHDYQSRLPEPPPKLVGHLLTGQTASVASGRVAYSLGWRGPALTVDTACSSSLVALHLAADALVGGGCELALAGGVAVMSTPHVFTEFGTQGALSPDGRCRSFADDADGFGIGEGVGVLLLARRSVAESRGYPVLAVMRGSAVNSDGASNGLTAPSGQAQVSVIGDALAAAALTPSDVDVVEAHGTGTRLGDPIEVRALATAYANRDRPLWMGSVKSNIGHAQAAAGVAGVIKIIQAMRHHTLPATLHADTPTGQVDWSATPLRVLVEPKPWPAGPGPRRAAVSSFGISGTNAHVVLEEPAARKQADPAAPDLPWVLSARTPEALRENASRILGVDAGAAEVASALTARTAFDERAVVLGHHRAALTAWVAGEESREVVSGTARAVDSVVFLYPGQGSQWLGMGADLLRSDPVFAESVDRCAEALAPHTDWSLRDALTGRVDLDRVDVVQPALWAVMIALTDVWAAAGVKPAAVIGHSQGEIAAACVAGALSLSDGALVVARRSALIREHLAGHGAMGAVAAAAADLDLPVGVSVAALNGPLSTTISGPPEAVGTALDAAAARGLRVRRVPVDYASHSAQVERLQAELLTALAGIEPRAPQTPMWSTVTGDLVSDAELHAEYWYRNLRDTVHFGPTVAGLVDAQTAVVEPSPHPTLIPVLDQDVLAVGTLARGDGGPSRVRAALGEAWVAGVPVDWTAHHRPGPDRVVLPGYPFQRRRHWVSATLMTGAGHDPVRHPVLAGAVDLPDEDSQDLLLTGRISQADHPWLADHTIDGQTVLPATAFVDVVLQAGSEVGLTCLSELVLHSALPVTGGASAVQVRLSPVGDDRRVRVLTRPEADRDAPWQLRASGLLVDSPGTDIEPWDGSGSRLDVSELYPELARRGYDYGPGFRGLRAAWRQGGDLVAEVEVPQAARCGGLDPDHVIHPALLDSAAQLVLAHAVDAGEAISAVPFAWENVRTAATGATRAVARASFDGSDRVRIGLTDPSGAPLLSGVLRLAERTGLAAADALLHLTWAPVPGVRTAEPVDAVHLTVTDDVAATVLAAAELVRASLGGQPRVVTITDAEAETPAGAAALGLLRSAHAEHPGLLRVVRTDHRVPVECGEPEVAVRGNEVFRPRLTRVERGLAPTTGTGAVVITGGTGVLGRATARFLAGRGTSRVVLLGRRGPGAPGIAGFADEVAGQTGARVEVLACDVTDRADLDTTLAEIRRSGPITGLVHAAGAVLDGVVEGVGAEQVAAVLAPKLDALRSLAELLADDPLDLFVVHSSAAGVLGSPGQGAYAAANRAVDALVANRVAAGLPGRSLAWGLWAERGGLTTGLGRADIRGLADLGLAPLPTDSAVALMEAALSCDHPVVVPVRLGQAGAAVPAVLRDVLGVRRPRAERRGATSKNTATTDDAASTKDTANRPGRDLLADVRTSAASVLGWDPGTAVSATSVFRDLGFDSLAAVRLRNKLATSTGLRLPATLVFDHPTPTVLAEHLTGLLAGTNEVEPVPAVAVDRSSDPIAVVSIGCRFPGGADDPDAFWELLARGGDAVGPVPTDRGWDPAAFGNLTGAFLSGAADFDAGLFGISPREALATDPQQRLLLETAWTAFERAGIAPTAVRGSRTGVFAGVMYHDYGTLGADVPDEVAGYVLNGSAGSVASGRVAYAFGLTGPAITVDTACSSSLVALHLAVRSLRTGECDLALAGGVTVMATPAPFTEFRRHGGLAADGRCKPFGAGADGTGWGEGAGLLLLERLSDARRNGHEVLAVVRGTSVNSDGASNGLTAPNGPAQQRVIRDALTDAGLAPPDVDLVEAHGTGTRLGDPIEAQAVLAVYGQDRARPLLLGSVKSNIGHTQAAAGVAGVIKVVQAMRHGVVPASLHATTTTGEVDWSSGAVEVASTARPWPENDRPRRAAVSAFGVSGTNAHVVLEQAEPLTTPVRPATTAPLAPWVLSARGEDALRAQAVALAEHCRDHSSDVVDVAFSLATGRAALPDRVVVAVGDPRERADALVRFAGGDRSAVVVDRVTEGGLAVVFSGQGTQRLGMGRELHATFPVFAAAFDEVCAAVDPHLRLALREVVFGEDSELLDRTEFAQPAVFAFQTALFRLWESWGTVPGVLIGHSIGEVTAAHVAGSLELAAAAQLICGRGRAMQDLPDGGGMLSVAAGAAEVAEVLTATVVIAARNNDNSTVLAGPLDDLAAAADVLRAVGHRVRSLRVSHAFHSPLMGAAIERIRDIAGSVEHRSPAVPIISTLTGNLVERFDDDHWARHAREAVDFAGAVAQTTDIGTYLEIGPDSTLSTLIGAGAIPSLRPSVSEADSMAAAVASVTARGQEPEWDRFFAGSGARRVPMPEYAFRRDRYWLPTAHPAAVGLDRVGLDPVGHPLAPAAMTTADDDRLLLSGLVSTATHPWLTDHLVGADVVVPGTALVDLVARVGAALGAKHVVELVLNTPIVVGSGVRLRVEAVPRAAGEHAVKIFCRDGDRPWIAHATAVLAPSEHAPGTWDGTCPPEHAEEVQLVEPAADGITYTGDFIAARRVWRSGDEVFAEVGPVTREAPGFGLHPALFDVALQAVAAGFDIRGEMPFTWSHVDLAGTSARELRVRAERRGAGMRVRLFEPGGVEVACVDSVVSRPVTSTGAPVLRHQRWFPLDLGVDPSTSPEVITAMDLVPETGGSATAARTTVERLLALLRNAITAAAPTVVLTRGFANATGDDRQDAAAAAVWGLVRTVQREHPNRFLLVDADTDTPDGRLLRAAAHMGEPQIALSGETVQVPRLVVLPTTPGSTSWGTVLITGATGALGRIVAQHLVDRGARHLVLLSASGPAAPGADEFVSALSAGGARADLVACDLADRAALAEVVGRVRLTAVVHCAGVVDDAAFDFQSARGLRKVFTPKVDSAWALHELTADHDLRAFVLFSSAAAVLGSPGQANYAAANAALDALARSRHARGLPATSIGWGLWDVEEGMAGAADTARLRRYGIGAMSPDSALALLDAAVTSVDPNPVALALDGVDPDPPAVLRPLDRRPTPASTRRSPVVNLVGPRRRTALLDLVRTAAADVLGHPDNRGVDARAGFLDLGFDSLTGVELRNRVSAATGAELPASMVFDLRTPLDLVDHLDRWLTGGADRARRSAVLTDLDRVTAALADDDLEPGLRAELTRRLGAALRPGPSSAPEADFDNPDQLMEYIDQNL